MRFASQKMCGAPTFNRIAEICAMASENYVGKTVVITGASSGFGRGTAYELAERGCNLVLAARSEELLFDVAKECEAIGAASMAVVTDVSDRGAMENLAQKAVARFGRIDVWINNAGVASIGRFDEVPLEDHLQVIHTDLEGTIVGSYLAIQQFRAHGGGILINVASVIGKIPAPFYASYAAAKFGIVGLCDALRQELGELGVENIHICTVMPMAHATEFFEHAGNYTGRRAEPIPPTYDPQVTVDALVKLVVEPENEVITGWQGGVFNVLHKLMPSAVEKLMASRTRKVQIDNASQAPITAGNVHEASES
jgi:short-subunit dehydrogenase